MPAVDPVILQLKVEAQQYKQQLQSTTILLENQLDKQERAIAHLGSEFQRSGNSIGGFFTMLRGAVSGLALAAAAREVLQYAEASKSMDAQLRLATQSFGSFSQAQKDAARIAADTRSGLVETASLYGNFTRATASLGGTQAEAARATETFSKALKIGGADAQSAASATLQFGQALASGVLRGDEFNSIAEASPRLLQLLADALGKPRSELRALAEDGKLTSDILFRALTDRRFTAGIDAEFKGLPITFGDAMKQVENAAIITFGAFDRGGQFSNALATFVQYGAGGFDDLADAAEKTGIDIRATMAGLSNVFIPMADGAGAAFGRISLDSRGVVQQIRDDITAILGLFDRANNFIIDISNRAANFDNTVARGLNRAINRAGGGQQFGYRPLQSRSDYAGAFTRGVSTSQTRAEEAAGSRNFLASIGLNSGASLRNPTPPRPDIRAASGGGAKKPRARGGRSGSGATKDVETAAEFIASIRSDLEKITRDTGSIIKTEADRLRESAQLYRDVFGDADPIGDAVAKADATRDPELQDAADFRDIQQTAAEDNIRSLANLYEDLFQGGTDAVWQNFKDQGLRAIALILAQATVTSFASGGGGFGSLLGNIGKGVGAFGGGGLGSLFGRASGGYVGPGQTVRVNEQRGGVELLRMGAQGGTVIPLGQTAVAQPRGGGATINQTINIDASGVNPAGYTDALIGIVRRETAQAINANNGGIRRSLPGALERYGKLGTTG